MVIAGGEQEHDGTKPSSGIGQLFDRDRNTHTPIVPGGGSHSAKLDSAWSERRSRLEVPGMGREHLQAAHAKTARPIHSAMRAGFS